MAKQKPIAQKKFVKGLIACTPNLSQVPGSVPRIINMVYTVRGGLKTCDGSGLVSYPSSDTTGAGAFLALKYYSKPSAIAQTATGAQKVSVTNESDPMLQGYSVPTINLEYGNVVPGTVTVGFPTYTGSPDFATDNGAGVMTDQYGNTGTINYQTGRIAMTGGTDGISVGPSSMAGATYSYYAVPGAAVGVASVGYEVALQQAPKRQLSPPAGMAFSPTSGPLAAGTYKFAVTASDLIPSSSALSGYRETYGTWGSYTLGGTGGINVTWSPSANAAAYVLYMVTTSPDGQIVALLTSTSYAFNVTPSGTVGVIPASNNTQTTVLRKLTTPTYGDGGILATLPASIIGSAPSGFQTPFGYTASGGQAGIMGPLPELVQFVNSIILILGNGLAPLLYTDGSPTSVITNTYTISYPSWAASTDYVLNDYIIPATPNGYYYQCTQAGESGGSAPSWPTTIGATVADGQVQWTCVASTTATPLRGAAHAVVYAGSLWLWNTYPQTTSDNLDGPSCLKMSSLENATSYDPLNVAFVDKDDGTEGTGMGVFSIAEAGIPPSNILILFKNYKSYSVTNVFGASNFSIQQIQTDMGNIAPRSIQFVPGIGVVRLSHLGFAATDGITDRLISEEIRPYLFPQVPPDPTIVPADQAYMPFAQSAQVVNPPMYICGMSYNNNGGMINRLYCYDPVEMAWTIINLPMNVYAIFQYRTGSIGIYTPLPTQLGGYSDGIVRNWQNGDSLWDTPASSVSWAFRTPEVYAAGAGGDPFFLTKVIVRGVSASPNPTITLIRQGQQDSAAKQPTTLWQGGANEFIMQAKFNARLFNASALIQGTGPTEIDLVEWEGKPKPTGVPLSLLK